MKTNVAVLTAAILALFIGGCTTLPDNSNPEARNIADEIHVDLDQYTRVTVDPQDAHGRLLRAYYLITVFSVYGNASIERYSHSPAGDAGGLLGRIMAAEAALQTSWPRIEANYYPVDRSSLIFMMADLAAKSIRPTATMAASLIGATPASGAAAALDIFRNALRDVVYGQAYLEGFHRSIFKLNGMPYIALSADSSIALKPNVSGDLKNPAWTELAQMLKATCETLKQKAKLTANKALSCGDLDKMGGQP